MNVSLNRPLLQLSLLWLLVLAGKYWYLQAEPADLLFLLRPTAWGTELLNGHSFSASTEQGLFDQQANILLSKDCSGFNFLLIALLAGGFALLPRLGQHLWLLPLCLLLAYGLTIFGNLMRISCLLFLGNVLQVPHWLHLLTGIVVYLCLLLPYSLLLSKTTLPALSHDN